jgi:hypothetical protein
MSLGDNVGSAQSNFKGGGDTSENEARLQGSKGTPSSSLNPFARSFVPRFEKKREEFYRTGPIDISNGGGNQWQAPPPPQPEESATSDGPRRERESDLEPDDYVALNELKEFIDTISSQPGRYDSLVGHVTDVLNNWMEEDEEIILLCVVNTIVDQAIMDQNFRYNGVRLCIHLIDSLKVVTSKGTFRDILMQRCQREHSRRESLAIATDGGAYLRGVTLVVSDLSTRRVEKDLMEALPDLLSTLLAHPTTDNLKCVCMVLKLCGSNLDEYFKNKGSPAFDQIMERLSTFVSNQTSKNTKDLISSVIELRERGWKSILSPMTNVYNPYAGGPNSSAPDDAGLPPFDPAFPSYDFGPCGDEQDNDVCEAFEEFLKASGQLPQ